MNHGMGVVQGENTTSTGASPVMAYRDIIRMPATALSSSSRQNMAMPMIEMAKKILMEGV